MKKLLKFLIDNECNINITKHSEDEFTIELRRGILFKSVIISYKCNIMLIDYLLMKMIDDLNKDVNALTDLL